MIYASVLISGSAIILAVLPIRLMFSGNTVSVAFRVMYSVRICLRFVGPHCAAVFLLFPFYFACISMFLTFFGIASPLM